MISAEGVERSCLSNAVGHVETGTVGQLISSGGVLEKLLHDLFHPQALQALTMHIEDCCSEKNKTVEFIEFYSKSFPRLGNCCTTLALGATLFLCLILQSAIRHL